jgi:putative membrane protein
MKLLCCAVFAISPLLPLSSMAAEPTAPASCCPDVKVSPAMTIQQFATTAGTVDLMEIKLGHVAQANASLPSVKKFGAYMVKSHTEIKAALAKVAEQEGVTIPTKLDPKHQAILKKLSALKGPAFDKAYIPAMVTGHTKVLAMLKAFEKSTTNPAFKKFAKKITPIIADHLKAAQKVEAEMTKAGLLAKS